ncbi:MAG: NADH-quinone oxidoreductase subunit J [Deltaproteobacteria bacterium]|nr:NADH-quinone oxidoreductase subunit J [Deltaproteobacteria bacterium]
MEQLFFYIFAFAAVISAILVISVRNPVHSAFFLIVTFMQVAAIFILLRSPFLAAVQVFVYVGAVMVLFLFAVLVLDMGKETMKEHLHGQSIPAGVMAVILFLLMCYMVVKGRIVANPGSYGEAALVNNTEVIGRELYTRFIYPFEIVSLILLVALVGAIALVMQSKGKEQGK